MLTGNDTGAAAGKVILSERRNPQSEDFGILRAAALPAVKRVASRAAGTLRRACIHFAALPLPLQYLLLFTAVALGHLTLLRLPYYWDEGSYYVPAALDFFHRSALIPAYTNAHPPLPAIVLGSVWRVTGFHILPTRLTACAFSAVALLAVFHLTLRLLKATAAAAVTLLTAVYPIWYAQSSLAHADIFAAAFVLAALALYLPLREGPISNGTLSWTGLLFSLAALSKETAIVWPATLAGLELLRAFRSKDTATRRNHLRWFVGMCVPVLPLLAWFAYHRLRTGYTFGNPEYLRYNATANFSAAHVLLAFRYRALHLFVQRNMWLPLIFAAACFFLFNKPASSRLPLPRSIFRTVAVLIAANWLFFSVLGGALLTRYLLPVYVLLLLVSVAVWQTRTRAWPWLAAVTAAAFLSAWWLSPPTAFAPEDCLLYRDMIVVHQEAIAYIDRHLPHATVLTAWPAAAELQRPVLGYTDRPVKVTSIANFTSAEVARAAAEPEAYDAALVVTTRYTEARRSRWLMAHPRTRLGQAFAVERDLTPQEVAGVLGGVIVFEDNRNGERAAVLRFPRSYAAKLTIPNSVHR